MGGTILWQGSRTSQNGEIEQNTSSHLPLLPARGCNVTCYLTHHHVLPDVVNRAHAKTNPPGFELFLLVILRQ